LRLQTDASEAASLKHPLALVSKRKIKKDMIMKIFALCLGIIGSVVALAIYTYCIKLRIKEVKDADEKRRSKPIDALDQT
jgi:hypothetical protein